MSGVDLDSITAFEGESGEYRLTRADMAELRFVDRVAFNQAVDKAKEARPGLNVEVLDDHIGPVTIRWWGGAA